MTRGRHCRTPLDATLSLAIRLASSSFLGPPLWPRGAAAPALQHTIKIIACAYAVSKCFCPDSETRIGLLRHSVSLPHCFLHFLFICIWLSVPTSVCLSVFLYLSIFVFVFPCLLLSFFFLSFLSLSMFSVFACLSFHPPSFPYLSLYLSPSPLSVCLCHHRHYHRHHRRRHACLPASLPFVCLHP